MTLKQAVRGANRINNQATYGTRAYHYALHIATTTTHTIRVHDVDGGIVGQYMTVEEARAAAGLGPDTR